MIVIQRLPHNTTPSFHPCRQNQNNCKNNSLLILIMKIKEFTDIRKVILPNKRLPIEKLYTLYSIVIYPI